MLLMVAISLLCSDGCDFPSIMVSIFWHVHSFKLHHFCYLHDFFVTYIFVYGSISCLCKHVVLMWAYRTARWNWFFRMHYRAYVHYLITSFGSHCIQTLYEVMLSFQIYIGEMVCEWCLCWGFCVLSGCHLTTLPWIIGFLHNLYAFIILFMVVRPLGSPFWQILDPP